MRKTLMLGAAAIALAIGGPAFAQTTPPAERPPAAAPDKAPGDRAAPRESDADRERMARLAAAEPAEKVAVSADSLIGTEVRNTQDEKLGTVKDIVLQANKISSIVIARGGVLGMGTTYHQIDIASVKMTQDRETVVLDLSEVQVKALPEVASKDGAWQPVAKADEESPPDARPAAPPSTEKKMDPPARDTSPAPGEKPAQQ